MIKTLFTLLLVIPLFTNAQLTCGSTFTDSGGSGATYSSSENMTYTVCPTTPGAHVRVDFSSFDVESGYDYLTVYNGNVEGVNLLGTYTGTTIDAFFESTTVDGCLTFVFTSDGSVENSGWIASITCIGGQPDPVDLTNIRSYNGNIEVSFDYTMIPNTQRRAMTFGAKVGNLTNQSSQGNTMNVVLNDGTSNVYTGSTTFDIAALDTQFVWVQSNYTPVVNKTYTLTVTLGSDINNSNNSKTFSFQTQNDYYAHDFTSTTTYGASALNTDYYLVNTFDGFGTGTVYSIDVKLAAGTTPNQTLRAFISSTNGFISEGTRLITAADINNGQFTKIYLDPPATISNTGDNFFYWAAVGSENLTGTLNTFSNTNNNDDNGSAILQNGVFSVIDRTVAVRMNFNQGCASFDATRTVIPAQSCNANSGRINLSITTGGTSVANQNNISWTGTSSGSLTNQPNNASITGLAAGTYNITITNNGCTMTFPNVGVGSVSSPTISVSETSAISCFGNSDGAISYSTSGTVTGYTFEWDNGSIATNLTNLSSGVYTISGTNGVCVLSQSFTLQDPAQIAITATKTNVSSCGGSNGAIQLNCTGGTSPNYLYTWTGPQSGSSGSGFLNSFSISNLVAGTYTINVTNGSCINTTVVSISENGAPAITVSNLAPISCPGQSDGDLKVNSTGNISQYDFTWSNGSTGVNLNNVPAGTYSVTGTNGTCIVAASFVLSDPAAIEISGITGVSTISTTVIGGTGNLSYAWTGPNGFTSNSPSLSGLTALGTYSLTVTDQNSCSVTRTFVLDFLGSEEIYDVANDFKYFPNPSNSKINFVVNNEIAEINIFDFSGKFIEVIKVSSELETLNLDSYANGIYFFNLISNDNQIVFRNKFSVVK